MSMQLKQLGPEHKEAAKALFTGVFTAEPWNDDWSDQDQLDLYLCDLMGQNNSLTYGLFDGSELIGLSMGHVKHWYSGTEYFIDEFCIRADRQGQGAGTFFLAEIEKAVKALGLTHLFLLTENNVPAFDFYRKNGFYQLPHHVGFAKQI